MNSDGLDTGRPFLIVHKGKRTGGTALIRALAEVGDLHVLLDPLHQSIQQPFSQLSEMSSDDWSSHHPRGYRYFDSYRPLLVEGLIPGVPSDVFAHYAPAPDARLDALFSYLAGLRDGVRGLRRIPVLAFEASEGRIAWLRRSFPDAIQLGVIRDYPGQLQSWFLQAAYGNFDFFRIAREIMTRNPGWFGLKGEQLPQGPLETLAASDLELIFRHYREHVVSEVIRRADIVLEHSDLVHKPQVVAQRILQPLELDTAEALDAFTGFLMTNGMQKDGQLASVRAAIDRQAEALSSNGRLRRELEVARCQRYEMDDELQALRSEIQEHRLALETVTAHADGLRRAHESMMRSKSWRYTTWLRMVAERLRAD